MRNRRAAVRTKKVKQAKALSRTDLFAKITAICEILDTVPGQQRGAMREILSNLYDGSCYDGS